MSITLLDAVTVLGLLIGILLLIAGIRLIKDRFALSAEVQRKLVHVATGGVALTFPWIFSGPAPVIALVGTAGVIMLSMRQSKVLMARFGSVLHDVQRQSYGEIYLVLSVGLLFLQSTEMRVLYVLPLLVITLSDTASALVGTSYGRRRFPVQDGTKSVEGVVAFFMVTWISAMIVLLMMTDAARINVIVLSLLIAGFCALVEADSWQGLDNLFIPVGAYLLLARHLETAPLPLVGVAVAFVAVVVVMHAIAPWLKMSSHAARAYTIMIFLVLSVFGVHNAVLPVIAMIAHIFARRFRPCQSESPDLDLLAIATGVALLWLVVGNTTGHTLINLYNFTFAVVAVMFSGLALVGLWRIALVPIGIGICGVWLWSVGMNPPFAIWSAPTWPLITLGVVVPSILVMWRSDWFATYRHIKAFALSAILPIVIFVLNGIAS